MSELPMSFVMYTLVRIMTAAMIFYSSAVHADFVERDSSEDPGSTAPHCMIFSKTSHSHEYRN